MAAMKASIDRLGRVVVPKPIRDKLRLRGGETLDVEERDGVIELRPAPTEVRLVETSEGLGAVPLDELPPLTDEQVRDVLEQVRR
jgi:AbrB family looped-hinge helix DNA binding protein